MAVRSRSFFWDAAKRFEKIDTLLHQNLWVADTQNAAAVVGNVCPLQLSLSAAAGMLRLCLNPLIQAQRDDAVEVTTSVCGPPRRASRGS
jgi:hypothetical protein